MRGAGWGALLAPRDVGDAAKGGGLLSFRRARGRMARLFLLQNPKAIAGGVFTGGMHVLCLIDRCTTRMVFDVAGCVPPVCLFVASLAGGRAAAASLFSQTRNHFEKREGMKVGGMFKSPMTIIMVLSMVMMFFLPKMMAGLDPEQLEVR